jgi:long-chain acyl-CoA synthetase
LAPTENPAAQGKWQGAIMERIWLRHYPPGVPAQIDASAYSSLAALLDDSFARYGTRKAFACMGTTLTFNQVNEASRAFAGWLQSLGMKPGARVALMMPNILQYPVAIAAVLRAGFTVVNVNPLYKPRELEFQLKDSGAEAIVVLENFASVLQQALPRTQVKHVVVAAMGDMLGMLKGLAVNLVVRRVKKLVPAYHLPGATRFNDALAAGRSLPLRKPALGPDDVAFLQ